MGDPFHGIHVIHVSSCGTSLDRSRGRGGRGSLIALQLDRSFFGSAIDPFNQWVGVMYVHPKSRLLITEARKARTFRIENWPIGKGHGLGFALPTEIEFSQLDLGLSDRQATP